MKKKNWRLRRGLAGVAVLTLGVLVHALDADLAGLDIDRDYPPAREPVEETAAAALAAEPPPLVSDDLLTTIGQGLVLPYREDKRVAAEYRWYANHPDYLLRVFSRAQRYLPHIVSEIERRGLPLDLALLPVVESAFDPFAYSHGRAAGLWQFIPSTGRLYGLKQNWWYDGRRDVVASTKAALDYLEALHRKVGGDWLLAIAAYNSGEGRVLGAVRRNRRAGLPTDFWHLKLPRETRAYVPKLLAISRIVVRRHELPIVLPLIADAPYFAVAQLDGQLDLALAAELAGTDVDEIYRLNPGFNRWATPAQGPHRLVVPAASLGAFAARLAGVPADERVRWQRYKVRPGDSLSAIARRHGTSTAAIQAANSLKGTRIRAGAHLMIPSASRELASYQLSADGRTARRLNSGGGRRYTVRSGDSFWSIGQEFGVSGRKIARWNGMAPADTLRVGRELIIRDATKSPLAAAGPAGAERRVAYVVRRGDSLAKISSRFRVSVRQLVNWNNLDRNKYLQPGQRLTMYVDVTRQSGG